MGGSSGRGRTFPFMRRMMLLLALGSWAWADPTPPPSQFDFKIVREYVENGENRRDEFTPSLRLTDQMLAMPALQDENAQQMVDSIMKMVFAQGGPLFQQFGNGEPFRMILEVPTMKEKLELEVNPK